MLNSAPFALSGAGYVLFFLWRFLLRSLCGCAVSSPCFVKKGSWIWLHWKWRAGCGRNKLCLCVSVGKGLSSFLGHFVFLGQLPGSFLASSCSWWCQFCVWWKPLSVEQSFEAVSAVSPATEPWAVAIFLVFVIMESKTSCCSFLTYVTHRSREATVRASCLNPDGSGLACASPRLRPGLWFDDVCIPERIKTRGWFWTK